MSKIYYHFTDSGYLLTRMDFINTSLRPSPHLFTFSVNNFVKKSISINIFGHNNYFNHYY
ncbi:hypothetical protein D1115_12755 [Vibrio alfacsensis]|uniref:Uncharacterized protein n=1 Tax=Vibrio alfacsensis TaxID=1074311 RepID=A0ABM6YVN8_9VIBR|nr:hypothetical protein D1115_12755 [Vibrio alfacsensis]